MADAASIRVIKSFTYRGVARTFSNRYHFTNNAPSDNTHWTSLSDAVVAAEKALYNPVANGGAEIIATVGYAGGSEVPIFNKTYSADGTLGLTTYAPMPGDAAFLVRYGTADRSSKNHPIYCFNYYHAVLSTANQATPDEMVPAQRTAAGTYASDWVSGFSDGTTNHVRCSPKGHIAIGSLVELLVTHRDLPR